MEQRACDHYGSELHRGARPDMRIRSALPRSSRRLPARFERNGTGQGYKQWYAVALIHRSSTFSLTITKPWNTG